MKPLTTQGIILHRTAYGEADRIITILTPEQGKLRLMARGVRKVKSKLAGGIELFSVSDLTYMHGKGEIGTLLSSRLVKHYGNIIQDIERVQLGYELIKMLDRATEDHPEEAYFKLLVTSFEDLNDPQIDLILIKLWFQAQLLRQAGHSPNLQTDTTGQKLKPNTKYNFDFNIMAFLPAAGGRFNANHIKTLRLLFSQNSPNALNQVQGIGDLLPVCRGLLETLTASFLPAYK